MSRIDLAFVDGRPIGRTNPVPVGMLAVATAEYTRPADAAPYAANDTIADSTATPTVLTFANMARVVGGSGYITRARIQTDQITNVARYRLHLFNVAPTAINDNAGCTAPLYADRVGWVGHLDFPACQIPGGTPTATFAQNITDRLPFSCAAADANLYGILQTLDAFTPATGQKFSVTLTADQN